MVFSCPLCPTFVHLFVTPWGVPGLQSNIVFHHLAQGTVGQADLLGICHCILGPSAQGGVELSVILLSAGLECIVSLVVIAGALNLHCTVDAATAGIYAIHCMCFLPGCLLS